MSENKQLFSPFTPNGHVLKNRIGVADIKANKPLPLYQSEDANVAYGDTPLP